MTDLDTAELLSALEPVAEDDLNRHISVAPEWMPHEIEHEINRFQLDRAQGADAAGRRLVLQVDVIVADDTSGWAERLRATGSPAAGPSPVGE